MCHLYVRVCIYVSVVVVMIGGTSDGDCSCRCSPPGEPPPGCRLLPPPLLTTGVGTMLLQQPRMLLWMLLFLGIAANVGIIAVIPILRAGELLHNVIFKSC